MTAEDHRKGRSRRCEKCDGKGRRKYKRNTYTHRLGRDLHPNNSGRMQWGEEYRVFHVEAWMLCVDYLRKGGAFILNISNHIRKGKEVPVAEFHVAVLLMLGLEEVAEHKIYTPRLRHGENHDLRVDHEWVFVFEKPK